MNKSLFNWILQYRFARSFIKIFFCPSRIQLNKVWDLYSIEFYIFIFCVILLLRSLFNSLILMNEVDMLTSKHWFLYSSFIHLNNRFNSRFDSLYLSCLLLRSSRILLNKNWILFNRILALEFYWIKIEYLFNRIPKHKLNSIEWRFIHPSFNLCFSYRINSLFYRTLVQ